MKYRSSIFKIEIKKERDRNIYLKAFKSLRIGNEFKFKFYPSDYSYKLVTYVYLSICSYRMREQNLKDFFLRVCDIYHDRNLVYTDVFPQFLIFQQNNSAQTSVLICFTSRHYFFF